MIGSDEFVSAVKRIAASPEVQASLEKTSQKVLASPQATKVMTQAVHDSMVDMVKMPFRIAGQVVTAPARIVGGLVKFLSA